MIRQAIDALTDHYQALGLLSPHDREYCRNRAFRLLQEPPQAYRPPQLGRKDALNTLLLAARDKKLLAGEGIAFEDDFMAKLTDVFMPRPGEYQEWIGDLLERSPEAATEKMYQVAIETEYIKLERVQQNIHHRYLADYGAVEITINLSKPEKSPEEIRLSQAAGSDYPACLLCKENVGLSEVPNPARSHHRLFQIELNGEDYFFQYSPYSYFNEHCIVFSKQHEPMEIDGRVIDRFLDFVDIFPHYFISANAELPIVGGSILTHDHYQGGRANFPIDSARSSLIYQSKELTVAKLDWPISAVRIEGDRQAVAQAAKKLINSWRSYSNPKLGILAQTDDIHNTVNLMARKPGRYQVILMFRNNRTDADNPDGIFHTNPVWQVVKRENIGIIEVMGLAILPARLMNEMGQFDQLPEYQKWLTAVPQVEPLDQLGYTFSQILKDCGVFKPDQESQAAFEAFVTGSLTGSESE